jgi:hypothetical protein
MAGDPRDAKDIEILRGLADRAHELLAQFEDLPEGERRYVHGLVTEFTKLVEAFIQRAKARLGEPRS